MAARGRFRICLVCLGNICRSPMAAAVLRRRLLDTGLADVVSVESAGTGSWHVGGPADPRTLVALRNRGLNGDGHRARQFTRASFAHYDLILALDRDNLAELHLLAPDDASRDKIQMLRAYDPLALASGDLDVHDPYYGSDDGFARVFDEIEPALDGLVQALTRELDNDPRGN
ncbi:MAG TPA: low molecular weight protein-tyrosine-phosphatase [Jiangellaceae bacterium]